MLLLVSTALGGAVNLGWPCSRMNWAWRNVWSTCSINSYIPTDVITHDHAPAHFRRAPILNADGPTAWLRATGTSAEIGSVAVLTTNAVPQFFCNNMGATLGNTHAAFSHLRNRCRRAIDSYGGIVRTCTTPAIGPFRGPIQGGAATNPLLTDFAPAAVHVPHQTNVANLATTARMCTEAVFAGTATSPHLTCPGLLGWWSVVFTACGFAANVPIVGASANPPQATPNVIPLGSSLSPRVYFVTSTDYATLTAPNLAGTPGFMFCAPSTTAFEPTSPHKWNNRGPEFRTSRCRKALDQFGRTAWRCGGTTFPSAASTPVQGSGDLLKNALLGADAATMPSGLARLAPLCN